MFNLEEVTVTNCETNKAFLTATNTATRNEILAAVGGRYGVTTTEALDEITHPEAEHLLDYLTGSIRTATSALMRRHGLAFN